MPGLNQTGPMGQGPMTGRGLGRCADAAWKSNAKSPNQNSMDEQDTTTFGNRGAFMGMGFGRGRGCRGMGRQARFGGFR